MRPPPVPVRFYVDGLNFYYGVSHPRAYGIQWIDLEKLLVALVREKIPNAEAEKILLFTAHIKNKEQDNQKIYLNALRAHSPCVRIKRGWFADVQKTGRVVADGAGGAAAAAAGGIATIKTWEEKQTDVNLACRIVEDAYIARANPAAAPYAVCCLVSNDSDMAYALETLRRLRRRVLLITPRATTATTPMSGMLKKYVPKKDRIAAIGKDLVAACELPAQVGNLYKPPRWR